MLDDFRLRVFMMVAAEGSFTRAAQHLGVSQPAVSQNIAELEKQVGAALFERGRGEVALTAEGYVFKDYAAKILHWYERPLLSGVPQKAHSLLRRSNAVPLGHPLNCKHPIKR